MNQNGLTEEQVKKRIQDGRVNRISAKNTNTVGRIILTNTLTIFNLVNLILALIEGVTTDMEDSSISFVDIMTEYEKKNK